MHDAHPVHIYSLDIGSRVKQQLDRFFFHVAKQQSGIAFFIFGIDLGPRRKQKSQRGGIFCFGGVHERRAALLVSGIDVESPAEYGFQLFGSVACAGAADHEQVRAVLVHRQRIGFGFNERGQHFHTFAGGIHNRRRAALVRQIGISSGGQQLSYEWQRLVADGKDQGGTTVGHGHIHLGSGRQKHVKHLRLIFTHRFDQRCGIIAFGGGDVGVGPGRKQYLNDVQPCAFLYCTEKRRFAIFILCVDLGPGCKQSLDGIGSFMLCGEMKRCLPLSIGLVRISSSLEQYVQAFHWKQFAPFVYCVEHNRTPPLVRLVGVAHSTEILR